MTSIGLVHGFWGQNVGNAFFNLGGAHLLEEAGHDVKLTRDQPAYATFRNEAKGNYANSFDLIGHLDVELVVLQGPLFTRNFLNIWEPTLRLLKRRGIEWAALACAFRSYTREEERVAAEAFKIHRPLFLSTRDSASSERLRNLEPSTRSGVCSAFFLNKAYQPAGISEVAPYVAFTFDHFPEPTLVEGEGPIRFAGKQFQPDFPKIGLAAARRTKAHAMASRLLDRRKMPTDIAGRTILRPDHRTSPHLPAKIYRAPNAVASDEPWTYLSVYAGAELTYSDRVHACVAALSYGNQAMLFNPTTKRSSLFDAVGAEQIAEKPVAVSQSRLDEEYGNAVEFLRDFG